MPAPPHAAVGQSLSECRSRKQYITCTLSKCIPGKTRVVLRSLLCRSHRVTARQAPPPRYLQHLTQSIVHGQQHLPEICLQVRADVLFSPNKPHGVIKHQSRSSCNNNSTAVTHLLAPFWIRCVWVTPGTGTASDPTVLAQRRACTTAPPAGRGSPACSRRTP